MSTLTPNYGLIVPDNTDTVAQVRADYATNLRTIDNNMGGGGGSGGHTIVNPSGSDMPAESKLQFTGGVTVTDDSANGKTVVDISGGGGNTYGAFIDTNRVITSGSYSSSYSYTATEDCYLYFTCGGTTSTSGKLYIDGLLMRYIFVNNSDNNYGDGVYLKKGQTAEVQSPQAGTFQYIVYGLTQGTNQVGHHYSTSEQVIGTWIDGKPLYEITVDVPNPSNDTNEHLIDLSALSIEECPYLFGYAIRHSGSNDITYYANSIEADSWYYFKARYDNFRDSIMYTCLFRNDSISRMRFTIQYTKSTD